MQRRTMASHPKGSWRWQNAYHVTTHEPRVLQRGVIVWWPVAFGPKRSEPQLRHLGLPTGSLRGVLLTAEERREYQLETVQRALQAVTGIADPSIAVDFLIEQKGG